MATAQGARFKENDAGNRRLSAEDVPVAGTNIPFEELLARELRKSEANARGSNETTQTGERRGGARKKSFLKKGARGWWMERPGAKKKLPRHTLTSKGLDEEPKNAASTRRSQQKTPSPTRTVSPPSSPPPMPPQTLSPPVSPIRRMQNSEAYADDNNNRQQRADGQAAWESLSLRSTSSNDLMGLNRVRQSYEAKQEREADEMAEFEAIERELAAEKDAYLTERRHQQESSSAFYPEQLQRLDDASRDDHWGLPYSTLTSGSHQAQRPASVDDVNLDADAHSALIFDDRSSISHDDWRPSRGTSIDHSSLSDQFSIEKHFGYAPSDLSAISFNDSEPWDDDLSFQPRQSVSSGGAGADASLTPSKAGYGSFNHPPRTSTTGQQSFNHENHANGNDQAGGRRQKVRGASDPEQVTDDEAPVSSLIQQVFGEAGLEESSNGRSLSYGHDDSSFISADDEHERAQSVSNGQSGSLSMLKQKLQGKQKQAVPRAPPIKERQPATRTKSRRGRGGKTKAAAPPRPPSRDKAGGATTNSKQFTRGPAVSISGGGPILPAVIEEKLCELEEEVKFYKSETLQLQKRKEYYDQEVNKLAKERDEFAQYQQEQRLLIEKEWEKERAKMKKEQKLLERQVKLRMNAAMSQQDRKDRSEVETLKAQIVKMQLDEKARVGKWKAGSDNLRQRVADLEAKNRELSDEIKFLEKDRLEQWGKYERLLKEKQEAPVTTVKATLSSSTETSNPTHFSGSNGLRTMDDMFTIKGTAEELLQSWSYPHDEDQQDSLEDEGRASSSSSGFHRGAPTTIADGYNPKRYSLDREDPGSSAETLNFDQNDCRTGESSAHNDVDDGLHPRRSSDAGFKWAFPDSGHNTTRHGLHGEDVAEKPEAGEDTPRGAISASTSSLSDKLVDQEIAHPGGKRELLYSDGSKKIVFPDGNEKEIDATGRVVIKFTNGDHKELFPDTGISVYYYFEAQTKLTTYPDGRKVYEFPNQQVETSLPDGTTEIQFADGIKKTIRPNGDEFSVFPDGTTMLEQTDGLREVTLLNQKRIRYFPDGQMACVTAGGQETRVRSDAELKRLMESS